MSDQPSTSNTPQGKAIASLAKKQSDVTRRGTQKLKFVPTLPAKRKKEEVKAEEPPASAAASTPQSPAASRGRGRGRGGRGRGDAAPARPPPVEMTASGPFAMGPALAGTSARRPAPRPTAPQPPRVGVKRELSAAGKTKEKDEGGEREEGEVYSDADEGVEILDMDDVRTMDWMAPETLRRERPGRRRVKDVKEREREKEKEKEKEKADVKGKSRAMEMDVDEHEGGKEPTKANLANAVHLSDSEEEEEMEDIVDDFARAVSMDTDADAGEHLRQDRLYLFQFPRPLPTFLAKPSGDTAPTAHAQDASSSKPETKTEPSGAAESPKVDGVVGQLEIYRSGAVKMRLGHDIVLDVTAATQPSFLQHAVHVDPAHKRICVLGDVHRRFVVSPDIDALLASVDRAAHPPPTGLDADGLISMDTT